MIFSTIFCVAKISLTIYLYYTLNDNDYHMVKCYLFRHKKHQKYDLINSIMIKIDKIRIVLMRKIQGEYNETISYS